MAVLLKRGATRSTWLNYSSSGTTLACSSDTPWLRLLHAAITPSLDSGVCSRVEHSRKGVSMIETLSIGQVARRTGVSVETVRVYEHEGLLEEPPRRASGYRQYSEQVIKRIQFIKRAQKLGFSLKEI